MSNLKKNTNDCWKQYIYFSPQGQCEQSIYLQKVVRLVRSIGKEREPVLHEMGQKLFCFLRTANHILVLEPLGVLS